MAGYVAARVLFSSCSCSAVDSLTEGLGREGKGGSEAERGGGRTGALLASCQPVSYPKRCFAEETKVLLHSFDGKVRFVLCDGLTTIEIADFIVEDVAEYCQLQPLSLSLAVKKG